MKILIIGSGYLGQKLALKLKSFANVSVTTKTEEKIPSLGKVSDHAFFLDTSDQKNLAKAIQDYDILIVCTAPKCLNDYEKTYLQTAKNIFSALKFNKGSVKRVIYTSSSSVYGDQAGAITSESSPLRAKSTFGKILVKTEEIYQKLSKIGIDVTIFRLSEIYGPGREISTKIKKYSEMSAPGDGSSPTNMIHVEDICHAIEFVINHRLNGIFNLCDSEHPLRKDMYDLVSSKLGLSTVLFDETKTSVHSGKKCLSSKKLIDFGFKLKHNKRIYS